MKKLSYIFLVAVSMMLTSCSGEFWQGFAEGGLALLSTAAYMPSAPSMGSGSMDYLLDPNYAIAQTKQNMHNEWYQATGGGQTMSYDEYWATKAQIEMNAKAAQTGSSSSSYETCPECSNGYNTKQWYAGNGQVKTTQQRCYKCHGTGKIRVSNVNY